MKQAMNVDILCHEILVYILMFPDEKRFKIPAKEMLCCYKIIYA